MLALGIAASLVAGRVRVPGLVLVLALGMVIGSDVLGLIHFGGTVEDVELARSVGVVALALILFEGGLASGWGEIRPVLGVSLSLATVGTVITAGVVGLAASWLLDLSTLEGLLLGSIVAASDSAAIFSVLRGSQLERRLARVLEGESGFNDPVAVVLVLGFIEYITGVGLRRAGHAAADLRRIGDRRPQWDSPSGGWPCSPSRACRSARRASIRWPRWRWRRSPSAPPMPCTASGFIAVYLTGLALGSAHDPGQAHDRRLPRRPGLDQPDRDVPDPRAAGQPIEFGDIAGEALLICALSDVRGPAPGHACGHGRCRFEPARVGAPGLGRAARRRADRAGHLPGDRGRGARGAVLQHRLLRRPSLDR